jgi:hypothetical protein
MVFGLGSALAVAFAFLHGLVLLRVRRFLAVFLRQTSAAQGKCQSDEDND